MIANKLQNANMCFHIEHAFQLFQHCYFKNDLEMTWVHDLAHPLGIPRFQPRKALLYHGSQGQIRSNNLSSWLNIVKQILIKLEVPPEVELLTKLWNSSIFLETWNRSPQMTFPWIENKYGLNCWFFVRVITTGYRLTVTNLWSL